jgi:uncharacterized protein (TIGR02646 family)
MRSLPVRPNLPFQTVQRLNAAVISIQGNANPVAEAERVFDNARRSQWFVPVIEALRGMTGPGERCMFCSGSESSNVEHFQPKAVFPALAMAWDNFLWACDICNRSKGIRFPPVNHPGERLIDPTSEYVWTFFFIDEYGNLTARWNNDIGDVDRRALNTIDLLSLDREALQQTRQYRLKDLKAKALDCLQLTASGMLNTDEVRARIEEWKIQPFQLDVADYFLNGPGKGEEPFAALFTAAGL